MSWVTRIRMHALLRELWSRHRPTVLLVTHDVDEAVLLADRALVLDKGRFVLDLPIDLPHPRTHRDPRLADYRGQLLVALGVPEEAEPPAAESGPDQRSELRPDQRSDQRSDLRSELNRELQEVTP
jgi:sulfonate transport system ATP-binding protein